MMLRDARTGRQTATLRQQTGYVVTPAFSPTVAPWPPAAPTAAALWRLPAGRPWKSFATGPHAVTALTFSPDGASLATASAHIAR
ncbi:MAG: hypothetical protein WKF75_21315 [Singulisphaera sp.]